jgi:tRNA 2-thiouridine synthesizing protein E
MEQWNENIAKEIASEIGIDLTDEHFKVLNYLREKTKEGASLSIRSVGKSGIIDVKGLYKLFPKGPISMANQLNLINKIVGGLSGVNSNSNHFFQYIYVSLNIFEFLL